MAFTTRVYLQGAGLFAMDADGKGMTVLYPSDQAVAAAKLPAIMSPHWAMLQLDSRTLEPHSKKAWTTILINGSSVQLHPTGKTAPFAIDGGGKIANVASLHDVLVAAGLPCKLRSDLAAREHELLRAKVRIEHGKVGPDTRFQISDWVFGKPQKVGLTNCVRVELGEAVEGLEVSLTPLGGGREARYRLHPVDGVVELWIRHYCDLAKPNPNSMVKLAAGEKDEDFMFNYALIEGADQADTKKLLVPEVATGGGVGVDGGKCQCAQC